MNIPASITALALAAGCLLSSPAGATEIVSRYFGGHCIDVSDANFQPGKAILLYVCKKSNNQIWSFEDGKISAPRASGWLACLGWSGPDDPPNGTPVTLQTCDINLHRRWAVSASGQISTPSGKCLDSTLNNATAITLRSCGDAGPGSIWAIY